VNPDAECSYTYTSLNFSYDHFLDLNALAPSSSLPPSPSSYLILIFCSLLPTASIVYLPFIPPTSCIFADLIFLKCNVSRIHYRFFLHCTASITYIILCRTPEVLRKSYYNTRRLQTVSRSTASSPERELLPVHKNDATMTALLYNG
jgi:hypothetical protein